MNIFPSRSLPQLVLPLTRWSLLLCGESAGFKGVVLLHTVGLIITTVCQIFRNLFSFLIFGFLDCTLILSIKPPLASPKALLWFPCFFPSPHTNTQKYQWTYEMFRAIQWQKSSGILWTHRVFHKSLVSCLLYVDDAVLNDQWLKFTFSLFWSALHKLWS